MTELYNRAKMTTATTGTGTITLGSAVAGFATFAEAGVANADVVSYTIEDGTDFEIGVGTYTSSGTTLSRDTVTLSKISGTAGTSKIDLSGSAVAFITARAEDFARRELFGVAADADTTNRLSVTSPAVLFNRETDDIQTKLNKQAAGDTASFLFQTNFSGRAEFGLIGDDDFTIKVSPDNFSTSFNAVVFDKDNGNATFVGAITAGGTVALADNLLTRPYLQDYAEVVNALGDLGGGTDNIDLTAGNVVSATVSTSAQTFTFSNPPATGRCGSFTLILTNGGSQTVNWPASVDWAGGTAPTLTAAGVDILTFFTIDGGTIWHGFAAGLDMS